jgi:diguanylate cyclase (GGDEF)-like protein
VAAVLALGNRVQLDARAFLVLGAAGLLLGLLLRQGRTVLGIVLVMLASLGLAPEKAEVLRWSTLVLAPVVLAALAWDRDWHPWGRRFALRLAGLTALAGMVAVTPEGLGPQGSAWFRVGSGILPDGLLPTAAGPPLAGWTLAIALVLAPAGMLVRRQPGSKAAWWSLVGLAAWWHGLPAALLAPLVGWIVAALETAHTLAWRDALTGLASRRAFDRELGELPTVYALAMVDVDHFKRLNDTWGHDVGDQVLAMVAAELGSTRGASAFRYGGEEFALVFRRVELAEAALERLRQRIAGRRFQVRAPVRRKSARGKGTGKAAVPVTVSIGWATPSRARTTPHDVLAAADRALYRAKEAGRNRVVAA